MADVMPTTITVTQWAMATASDPAASADSARRHSARRRRAGGLAVDEREHAQPGRLLLGHALVSSAGVAQPLHLAARHVRADVLDERDCASDQVVVPLQPGKVGHLRQRVDECPRTRVCDSIVGDSERLETRHTSGRNRLGNGFGLAVPVARAKTAPPDGRRAEGEPAPSRLGGRPAQRRCSAAAAEQAPPPARPAAAPERRG
eukprot:scaffold26962_cov114-Isochrysis_galbana.AAC.1